jgi:Acetyltransferase (GNAT) domain
MINVVDKEYSIARLSKDNLADVARLHTAVYGMAAMDDYFSRKYNTAYTAVENVGFIAYTRDKRPVAYYGVIPCFIQFENEVILAAQSADTMTDPQHRYKGMFVELSNLTFDLCRQLGIKLIFGFPNQNSYHGAVTKLGWKMTDAMVCFTIPVKSIPLESLSKKIKFLKNMYEKYSRFILKRKMLPAHGVTNSVLVDGFAGVFRNEEYLYYKRYSATKVISIDTSKIWINNKYGLVIGDMEGVNEINFGTIIHKLERLAKNLGVKQIHFHCSPGTSLHQLFFKNYKAIASYPMLFQDFGSTVPPEKIRFTFADIDII